MSVIYEPRGKAGEYSPLAANLYKGCSHGCAYCYVPTIPPYKFSKSARQDFYSAPAPRSNILKELEKDAQKFAGDKRRILMSFTSDAYQPCERNHEITAQALRIMAKHGLKPQILTKAGEWAVWRDANILKKSGCIWAATLTFDEEKPALEWEPGAALPEDRFAALELAPSLGIETWASLEPVLDPDAAIRIIQKTHKFVDLYKIGKLNYHPKEKEIDWHKFLVSVEAELNRLGKARYIKKDLEKFRQ